MSLDAQDALYIAKLKKSKRDPALVAVFILLLLAMKRLQPTTSLETIASELAPTTTALAARVAAYVARQLHTTPEPTRRVAAPLLKDITTHAYEALKLAPDARNARLGLIAQAELQHATMVATRRAAGTQTLVRTVHSGNPCQRCWDLQGTYTAPYPQDLWYFHPRCCCEISVT